MIDEFGPEKEEESEGVEMDDEERPIQPIPPPAVVKKSRKKRKAVAASDNTNNNANN